MSRRLTSLLAAAAILVLPVSGAMAADGHSYIPDVKFSSDGPFGTYDKASLQRGLHVYRSVCAACHGMKRVAFRNLEALGYNEAQIKTIASQYSVVDGPNDEGEMFERPSLPSDRMHGPYANDAAARYSNNGALPPDLSLITKARVGGAAYVYGILTGYEEPPEGTELLDGQYWNKSMTGHVIAMAPPLSDGQVAYEDEAPQTVDQYSKDVSHFLAWAAEPEMEARKAMGVRVFLFLAAFAGIMIAVKRKIWAKLH